MTKREDAESELAAALLNAVDSPQFFNDWYKVRGHAYCFIFTKNLKITKSHMVSFYDTYCNPLDRDRSMRQNERATRLRG